MYFMYIDSRNKIKQAFKKQHIYLIMNYLLKCKVQLLNTEAVITFVATLEFAGKTMLPSNSSP
jgi:hypothetical protein